MSASDVAGLIVLLGVVGVLAAVTGSGIEAGPIKFPTIPRARQSPLASVSLALLAGVLVWRIVERHSAEDATATAPAAAAGHSTEVVAP